MKRISSLLLLLLPLTMGFSCEGEYPRLIVPQDRNCVVDEECSLWIEIQGNPMPDVEIRSALPAGLEFDHSTLVVHGTPESGTEGPQEVEFWAGNSFGETTEYLVFDVLPVEMQ